MSPSIFDRMPDTLMHPMDRYRCVCGAQCLTGAIEWDNLSPRKQWGRIIDIPAIFLIFFFALWIMALPASLIAYLRLHSLKAGLIVGLVVATIPALVIPVLDLSDILRSIIRTRFLTREQAAGVRN